MSSSGYKRKRYSTAATSLAVIRPYRTPYKKRRTFVAGRDRVGGFYGRYAGRGAELKFLDTTVNDAIVAATGGITDTVLVIPQGVTESERVGRKCMLRQIHWRYQVSLAERDAVADPVAGDSLRIILYQDKQCNGATAAIGDVLATASVRSFRDLANTGRFNILMDKIHNINYMTLASDGAGVVSQAEHVQNYTYTKLCNLPIEYSSTTGAIGEIKSNNIGILLISSSGVVRFDSTLRIRFSDG